MELPPKGSVVAVRFPFSDLSSTKLRPALVLAVLDRKDLILMQITSRDYGDPHSVPLTEKDFSKGGLPLRSFIRVGKIFTGNAEILQAHLGVLTT